VKEMNEKRVPENRAYKVTLILLVGLAAFSTAMRDLNRLREMVNGVQEFTSQWRGSDSVAMNENPIATVESCPKDIQELINSSVESGERHSVALAGIDEVDGVDCETIAEPEVGAKVELVGSKKSNRSVARLARAKYSPPRNPGEEFSMTQQGKWPVRFEYKTFDRTVTLDLPVMMVNEIKGEFDANGAPNVPLSFGKVGRKQSHGKADTGRREFIFKRLDRVISSRRAS
jgi:hypothetical protein